MILRPYQEKQIQAARNSVVAHGNTLIQGSTGSGKTVIATFIALAQKNKGRTLWFICHRKELILQTSKTFLKNGIEHGFIAAGHSESNHLIKICSIDTLKRRIHKLKSPYMAIWDECHHLGAKGWEKTLEYMK